MRAVAPDLSPSKGALQAFDHCSLRIHVRQFMKPRNARTTGLQPLSGLMGLLFGSPRVARSSAFAGLRRDESQPWAERCNPFGIEPNGPAPQKPVASVGRFCQSRCLLRLVGLLWVFCATLLQGAEAVDWQAGEGFRSRELKLPSTGRTFLERLPPASTGVVFTNVVSQEKALENSLLASGSGVAAGDVDGDGWCDLYFCGMENR